MPATAHAPPPAAAATALAQQFERQGMRCTEDASDPQLWCSYCTAYMDERYAAMHATGESSERQKKASQAAPQRSRSRSRSQLSETHPQARGDLVAIKPTKEAVLAHCATRLHLHLYEHHTQENLRHWCPVELHGYRMLLNHHCVYPARMFGDGRLLMDFTIAGGMLLANDVCGGVKLWPQHRYAAAELVLPSYRSGVREVWVQEETADISSSSNQASSGKRRREEGRFVQLLHESSEVPVEVAWAYHNEDAVREEDEIASLPNRRAQTDINLSIPRYFDEDHRVRSRCVMEGTLTDVLDATNTAIVGEARRFEKRLRHSVKHNVAGSSEVFNEKEANA